MAKLLIKHLIMGATLFLLMACNTEEISNNMNPDINQEKEIQLIVNQESFTITVFDNTSADALLSLLPLTLEMRDLNSNEKYATLPQSLPTAPIQPATIYTGDMMLYGNNTLVIFYKTFDNVYSYTPMGKVNHPQRLQQVLGSGNVSITLEKIKN